MADIQSEYAELLQKLTDAQNQAALLKRHIASQKKRNQDFMTLFIKGKPDDSIGKCAEDIRGAANALKKETEEELKKFSLVDEYAAICKQQSLLRSPGVQVVLLLQKTGAKGAEKLSHALLNCSVAEAISAYNEKVSEISRAAVEPETVRKQLAIRARGTNSVITFNVEKVAKGDIITFGSYPQDKQGKEKTPIEWRVLEKENNRIFVISEHALDCQRYNSIKASTTWETCSLRAWLNETFFTNAFSLMEQAKIPTVKVVAEANQTAYKKTEQGKNTKDKVFLLSYNEIRKYFRLIKSRKCIPTGYAIAQGSSATRDSGGATGNLYCWWWLRSSGSSPDHASMIDIDGSSYSDGYVVSSTKGGVRPVLWIDLDGC